MAMLADLVDVVIGVDTHNDTHTAAVVTAATGAVVEQATVPATPAGYRQLLRLAGQQPGQHRSRRCLRSPTSAGLDGGPPASAAAGSRAGSPKR